MTMLAIEGFDGIAVADLSLKGWNYDQAQIGSGYKRLYGSGFYLVNYLGYLSRPITSSSTVVVGFGFKALGGGGQSGVVAFGNSTTYHASCRYNFTLQRIEIWDANNALIGNTANGSVKQDTWYYIEVKVLVGDSPSGRVDLQINGVVPSGFPLTSVDTRNGATTTIDNIRFGAGAADASSLVALDDIYIFDTNGSTNNDFIGQAVVQTIVPNGDGSVAWSRSGGSTNYGNVDETVQNGDTDYVYTSTAAQQDFYNFTNLAANTATVYGLQVNGCARKDDSGARSLKLLTKSGATTSTGSTHSLDTSYTYYQRVQETDPNTSTAWTKTTVDAAQFGVESA